MLKDEKNIYVIFDCLKCGDLFGLLKKQTRFEENRSKIYIA